MSTVPASNAVSQIESFADGLTVRVNERGSGRPILVLHGGGGPFSVLGFTEALAEHAHVLAPIHPGFGNEPRPEWFDSIDDLALTYVELLERRDLHDVMVIGLSMGGWIASEIALRGSTRVSSLVMVDAVGIEVAGQEVANVFTLSPDGLSALSYHNPEAFKVDPATLSPAQVAGRAANFQALAVYSKARNMGDPKLRRRLGQVKVPTLVVWGESDGVVRPDYGRVFAEAIPKARFELIPEAGHMPQLEQPARLLKLVREFADNVSVSPVLTKVVH